MSNIKNLDKIKKAAISALEPISHVPDVFNIVWDLIFGPYIVHFTTYKKIKLNEHFDIYMTPDDNFQVYPTVSSLIKGLNLTIDQFDQCLKIGGKRDDWYFEIICYGFDHPIIQNPIWVGWEKFTPDHPVDDWKTCISACSPISFFRDGQACDNWLEGCKNRFRDTAPLVGYNYVKFAPRDGNEYLFQYKPISY